MSDEKKGKVFLISMTVIIVLLFLSQGVYPKYKAGKYEEEQNCLDTSNVQPKLLVDGVTVNIVQEEEETETAESSSNTATAGGRLGGDSFDTSTSSGNASIRRTDPYDVYDYDDPDDFADEWAEEFGDGDYDDGYDDAYDYWEDAWY